MKMPQSIFKKAIELIDMVFNLLDVTIVSMCKNLNNIVKIVKYNLQDTFVKFVIYMMMTILIKEIFIVISAKCVDMVALKIIFIAMIAIVVYP